MVYNTLHRKLKIDQDEPTKISSTAERVSISCFISGTRRVTLVWYSVLWKHLAFNVCLVLEIQCFSPFNTDFANVYFTGVYLLDAILTMYFLFYISKKYLPV